jgi:hypothetical protein
MAALSYMRPKWQKKTVKDLRTLLRAGDLR